MIFISQISSRLARSMFAVGFLFRNVEILHQLVGSCVLWIWKVLEVYVVCFFTLEVVGSSINDTQKVTGLVTENTTPQGLVTEEAIPYPQAMQFSDKEMFSWKSLYSYSLCLPSPVQSRVIFSYLKSSVSLSYFWFVILFMALSVILLLPFNYLTRSPPSRRQPLLLLVIFSQLLLGGICLHNSVVILHKQASCLFTTATTVYMALRNLLFFWSSNKKNMTANRYQPFRKQCAWQSFQKPRNL